MAKLWQRVMLLAVSVCNTVSSVRNSKSESLGPTPGQGLRHETVSQAESLPSSTIHPPWVPHDDVTRHYLNDSWLDWPPWNLTDREWLEWEADDNDVALFWIGCMIPAPIILAIIYIIYHLYVSRVRPQSNGNHHGVLCRFWHRPKQYTCCKNNNRDSYRDTLCDSDALSADFCQLANDPTRSATDIEAAYNMDSGVLIPHVKLLLANTSSPSHSTTTPTYSHRESGVSYQQLDSDEESPS